MNAKSSCAQGWESANNCVGSSKFLFNLVMCSLVFYLQSNYFWLYIVGDCNSYFTEIATEFYVSPFSIHWNFWNFLSENEWLAMLQDNWGKYKQSFSRRSNTIKAEVAMSQFLEPHSIGLNLAKLTRYMFMLLPKCWHPYKTLCTLWTDQILRLSLHDWWQLCKRMVPRIANRAIFQVFLTKLQAAMLVKIPTQTKSKL